MRSRLRLVPVLIVAACLASAIHAETPPKAPAVISEVTSETPPLRPDDDKMGTFARIFLDHSTGLYWTNVINYSESYSDGARDCAWLSGGTAGDGWRLPTKAELKAVAKNGIGKYSKVIGDNGSSIWSSNVSERASGYGWVVTITGSQFAPAGSAVDDALLISQRPVLCVRSDPEKPAASPRRAF